jgi:hypothetical protein
MRGDITDSAGPQQTCEWYGWVSGAPQDVKFELYKEKTGLIDRFTPGEKVKVRQLAKIGSPHIYSLHVLRFIQTVVG